MKLAWVVRLGAVSCFYSSASVTSAHLDGQQGEGEESETSKQSLVGSLSLPAVGEGKEKGNATKAITAFEESGILPVPSSGHSLEQKIDQIETISGFLKEKDHALSQLDTSEFPVLQSYVAVAREQLKSAFKEISTIVDLMSSNLDSSSDHYTTETDKFTELDTVSQRRRMNEDPREKESSRKKKHGHRQQQAWDKFRSSSNRNEAIFEMHEALMNGDASFFDGKLSSLHRSARSYTPNGRRMNFMDVDSENDEDSEKFRQCTQLVECAKGMSLYDLFVYYYSDDIDPATGTVDDVTITFDEANLFEKQTRIEAAMEEADALVQMGEDDFKTRLHDGPDPCDRLLQEFHRNIEIEGSANWQGAMVNQVCLAEGTTVYVKLTEIERVTNKKVATEVFVEILRCARYLFEMGRNGAEPGSFNENEPFVFTSPNGYLRFPKAFDRSARDEHGQLLNSTQDAFEFKTYTPMLRKYDDSEVFDDELEDSDLMFTAAQLQVYCRTQVEKYYTRIFLAPESGTDVRFPSVYIKGERVESCGLDCDRYKFQLSTPNPVDNIPNPTCGHWFQDDRGGGGNPSCIGRRGCLYYAVKRNENFFSGSGITVEEIENALMLVFGEKPSLGFICGIAQAVVRYNKPLPGYCCLDAPYQATPWGQEYACNELNENGIEVRKPATECKNPGPFLAGISSKVCEAYGGTWCPAQQDCSDLKDCVEEYIQCAEDENRTSFARYLDNAPNITNPEDPYMCGRARAYFGFEENFLNDEQICDDILQLRNSRDFDFLDEFFDQGGGNDQPADPNCGYMLTEPLSMDSFPHEVRNGQIWRSANFALSQIADSYESTANLIEASDCPSETITNAICVAIKNYSSAFAIIVEYALRRVVTWSDFIYNEFAELGSVEPREIYENTKVIFGNMETTLRIQTEGFEAVRERFNEVQARFTEVQTELTSEFGAIQANFTDVFGNMETTLRIQTEGFEAVRESFTEVLARLTEVQTELTTEFGAIQANFTDVQKQLKPPTFFIGTKFAGCDGIDQDGDDAADECDEDEFPPSLVLPECLQRKNECIGQGICLGKFFKSTDEAKEYLESNIQVTDDCANPEDLSIEAAKVTGSCSETSFIVTPWHRRYAAVDTACPTDYELSGKPITFTLGVDDIPPAITCGFSAVQDSDDTRMIDYDRKTLVVFEDDDTLVDASFFYDIEENCPGIVDVELSVSSNEVSRAEMVFVAVKNTLGGLPEAKVFIQPISCDGDNKDPTCQKDPSTSLRFYELVVKATDKAGWTAIDTCTVIVYPKPRRNQPVLSPGVLAGIVSGSTNRVSLATASMSLEWDNARAPSSTPSSMPSLWPTALPSLKPSASPSTMPSVSSAPSVVSLNPSAAPRSTKQMMRNRN